MYLAFDSEQEALRAEFRKVLATLTLRGQLDWIASGAALDQALWTRLAELGWLATAIDEAAGGSGLAELMLCVQAEEIGRSLAAVPFASSICGYAVGLAHVTDASLRAQLLPDVAQGSTIGVMLTAECWREPPRLADGKDGPRLSGVAGNVLDGAAATAALACVESSSGPVIVQLDIAAGDKSGRQGEPLDLLHPCATLSFSSHPARVLAGGPVAQQKWQDILDRYTLFIAFEQLGGAAAALEMARLHALDRYAFGRPIASFQGLKHSFADLFVALDLARSNCLFGAAALNSAPELLHEAAAVARISATEAFRRCARGNMQMHGALGVTWESGCHLYYRRAQVLAGHPDSINACKEGLVRTLLARESTTGMQAASTLGT